MRFLFFLFCTLFISLACEKEVKKKNDSFSRKATSLGPFNTVTVFSSAEFYENELSAVLNDVDFLGKPYPGLYFPAEKTFNSRQFNQDKFNSFRRTRNIIFIEPADSDTIEIKKDVYAYPQTFVKVRAENKAAVIALLESNKDILMQSFKQSDLLFLLSHLDTNSTAFPKELKNMGLQIFVPNDFDLIEEKENFIRYKKKKNNMIYSSTKNNAVGRTYKSTDFIELLIYELKDNKEELQYQDIVQIADSVKKANLKGIDKDDYPQTDPTVSADYGSLKKIASNGAQDIYQLDGYWSMTKSQFGGPMLMKIVKDKKQKKLYIVDGFMFAPLNPNKSNQNNNKKRNYLTDLEAIFYTFKTTTP